jgi:hypothetical protein
MLETFIGAVLGTIFSILVTIVVENLRRPNLRITIEPPGDYALGAVGAGAASEFYRALKVRVSNERLPFLAGWMERGVALGCRGTITFHHLGDGQDVFGRALCARWAGGLQPTAIPIVSAVSNQVEQYLADDQRLAGGSVMDIHSGDSEFLDVAARFKNDQNCYAWNNESYFVQPTGRNPKWELGHDRFLIRIVIRSSGHTRVSFFKLINDVPETSFRLEEATRAERARVRLSG